MSVHTNEKSMMKETMIISTTASSDEWRPRKRYASATEPDGSWAMSSYCRRGERGMGTREPGSGVRYDRTCTAGSEFVWRRRAPRAPSSRGWRATAQLHGRGGSAAGVRLVAAHQPHEDPAEEDADEEELRADGEAEVEDAFVRHADEQRGEEEDADDEGGEEPQEGQRRVDEQQPAGEHAALQQREDLPPAACRGHVEGTWRACRGRAEGTMMAR